MKKSNPTPHSFLSTYISGLNPGAIYPRHSHGSWELLLIMQGALQIKTKQSESHGVAGSIFIRPPGTMHEELCTSSVGLKAQVVFWKPRRDTMELGHLPRKSFDSTGRVQHAMSWLYDLNATPDLEHHYLDELLGLLLLECVRTAQPRVENRWSNVTNYVHLHLAETLTLDQMARIAGMSKNYFVEEFHRDIGLSPMAYIRQARLDRACRAITQTNKVFSEIAQENGFRDEYEFSRVFRRVMGFAPSTLRPRVSQLRSSNGAPAPLRIRG